MRVIATDQLITIFGSKRLRNFTPCRITGVNLVYHQGGIMSHSTGCLFLVTPVRIDNHGRSFWKVTGWRGVANISNDRVYIARTKVVQILIH